MAAYVLGMYIPGNYFSSLKPCTDSAQTGWIIGWRTFKNGYTPGFVENESIRSLVTNPLDWKTSSEHVSYAYNKGAVTTKFNRIQKSATDAQIHGGILWINRPRIPGSIFLRLKNFHIGDINLFYINIRENCRLRVKRLQGNEWKRIIALVRLTVADSQRQGMSRAEKSIPRVYGIIWHSHLHTNHFNLQLWLRYTQYMPRAGMEQLHVAQRNYQPV